MHLPDLTGGCLCGIYSGIGIPAHSHTWREERLMVLPAHDSLHNPTQNTPDYKFRATLPHPAVRCPRYTPLNCALAYGILYPVDQKPACYCHELSKKTDFQGLIKRDE